MKLGAMQTPCNHELLAESLMNCHHRTSSGILTGVRKYLAVAGPETESVIDSIVADPNSRGFLVQPAADTTLVVEFV